MSRTKRFLGGVALGYAQQALTVITGLWLTPFLLHRIGQHDYGLWLVGFQLLTWLTLMDFGIVALLPRETAYAVGRSGTVESAADLPIIIGQTARIILLQTPIVAIAAFTCWLLIPSSANGLQGPAALALSAFTVAFPLRIFRAILEGLQDLVFLGRLQITGWALGILTTVCLVLAGTHLYSLAIGWIATQGSVSLVCLIRLLRRYPTVLPSKRDHILGGALGRQFGRGAWVSLSQFAQVLLDGTDMLIVGKSLGASAVVPYACTEKLIGVLSNQPTMLMHAAAPGLSAIKASGDRNHAFQVAVSLTQALLILSGAVGCITLAVNHGFVSWWVGPHQFGGVWLSASLILAMILRHWNVTAVYSIFCFGFERRISITTVIDGLVTVSSSLLLVRYFGAIGAPLGSILGVCLISLPANLSALSIESGKSLSAALLPLWPWFWRFLLIALVSLAISKLWIPSSPVGILACALSVGSTYTLVMFPLLITSSLRQYLPRSIMDAMEKRMGSLSSLAYPAIKN